MVSKLTEKTTPLARQLGTPSATANRPRAGSPRSKIACARSAISARPAPCLAGTRRPTCRVVEPPRGRVKERPSTGWRIEKSVDPALGKLLDQLHGFGEGLPYDSDAASLIRVARRDFEKAIKVPADYVARASAFSSASYDAWTRARPVNDYATMRPFLERALELSREYASFFAPYANIADPLIDSADEGMTVASVRTLFADLRRELVPIVRAIADQPLADDSCLRGAFGEGKQLEFSLIAARSIGYDLVRGRLDKTHHPFCTKFSAGDVRITTRVYDNDVGQALFSTLHEAGHALYEQGVATDLEGTPLGSGTSAGVHESQSRLWENIVGRSRGFWHHFYPRLQATFPHQLEGCVARHLLSRH